MMQYLSHKTAMPFIAFPHYINSISLKPFTYQCPYYMNKVFELLIFKTRENTQELKCPLRKINTCQTVSSSTCIKTADKNNLNTLEHNLKERKLVKRV